MIRSLSLGASLFAMVACAPEFGAPDVSRGSADSPMTMLVDQMNNGTPRQGGGQNMMGPSDWRRSQGTVTRAQAGASNFGGAQRPIQASGGESF